MLPRMSASILSLYLLEANSTHTHTHTHCENQKISVQSRATSVGQMCSRYSKKFGLTVMNGAQGKRRDER